MLGEWYLPPGACQVISTITEGTISFSRPPLIIHLSGDDPNTVSVSTSRLNPSSRISPQIRSSEAVAVSGCGDPIAVGGLLRRCSFIADRRRRHAGPWLGCLGSSPVP